jgi:hypothetical protein
MRRGCAGCGLALAIAVVAVPLAALAVFAVNAWLSYHP